MSNIVTATVTTPSGPPSSHTTKANPVHAMVAGYLAGSSGTIVGYPLESLKVWVQTNTLGQNQHLSSSKKGPKRRKEAPSKTKASACGKSVSCSNSTKNDLSSYGAKRSNSTTTFPRMKHITKPASTAARTVRALYSGVMGPLVTVGMVQSVNFATYDATRRFLYQSPHENSKEYLTKDSLKNVAMSGSAGGVATATLTAPLLMIKIHQQISGKTFRKACRDVFFKESARGKKQFSPFRPYGPAFLPHLLSEAVGRSIYVTTYEGLKRHRLKSKDDDSGLTLFERMACAAASGIACWGTFFPLDALRNRMYHASTRQQLKVPSVLETVTIMRKERAFYRGFSISILRAGPVAASVLPVYDLTLEWLSSNQHH